MPILRRIGLLATCRMEGPQSAIHCIDQAAIVWRGQQIVWVGKEQYLPDQYAGLDEFDANGTLVAPGLIDCHTHLAFSGSRADEFSRRIAGESYAEIAQKGGGIARTVTSTRKASNNELLQHCSAVVEDMRSLGVTTLEAKSGYGLTVDDEIRILRVYETLQHSQAVTIVPTLLAAHCIPEEYQKKRKEYCDIIANQIIPTVAQYGLARFCDVFVEKIAFSVDEARLILTGAKRNGLDAKLHADQLTNGSGAALAAELSAASADHLECTDEVGIQKMANADVVAVNLPIASLYLDQHVMPARRFIDAGVPLAIATDFNPGSAPSYHLPMAMLLACTRQKMTPAETLKAVTIIAAKALRLEHDRGSIEVGKRADFIIVDAPTVEHWISHFRANAVVRTFIGGSPC